MIKQGLNIKLGQSLSMTPQLQQAIKLLQLSSTELEQEIQEILDTNPLLERTADSQTTWMKIQPTKQVRNPKTRKWLLQTSDSSENNNLDAQNEYHSRRNEHIDADWDEIYDPEWKTSNNNDSIESVPSDFIETMHSADHRVYMNI